MFLGVIMNDLYDLKNNFVHYYNFYISALSGNFTKAGNSNHISSSSLSRSVNELEKILGLSLIVSTNKGFNLTLDGERLFRKLDSIFNSMSKLSTAELMTGDDVVLTIGVTRNIADYLLPPILNEFIKKYPYVKTKIIIDSASNLNEYIVNHKIDVLVDYLPHINYSTKFEFSVKPIAEYKTCFACSKKYYEEIKNKINSLSDLKQETLVISGSSRRRQMLDEVLQKNNIELMPKHLMPDSKLMADIIKENNFIGYFIEDEVIEYDLQKLELKEQMPINAIGIIFPKCLTNDITQKFIETI